MLEIYTDEQLKQALAKMLPETVQTCKIGDKEFLVRKDTSIFDGHYIRDTELLHLCWLVEEHLTGEETIKYSNDLLHDVSATWQQRTIALCKVKIIDI